MKRFNLSAWAVSHPTLVLFLMIILGVAGFFSYQKLGRAEEARTVAAEVLAQHRQHRGLQVRLTELTERERDVMRLVVEGLPNKLIADQLDISVRTVEVHRSRVFDKMNVKSAVELANLLRSLG